MANLWIRTQNKENLAIIKSLCYANHGGKNFVMSGEETTFDIVLGKYHTKERCIEIINEIQKLLQSNGLIIFKDIECDNLSHKDIEPFKPLFYQSSVVSSDKGEITVHNVEDLVYEMPEE